MFELTIPEYEEGANESYPGGITPGVYSLNEVVNMLRLHKNDPDVIQFIADMLET